jgi:hypothetical protein
MSSKKSFKKKKKKKKIEWCPINPWYNVSWSKTHYFRITLKEFESTKIKRDTDLGVLIQTELHSYTNGCD